MSKEFLQAVDQFAKRSRRVALGVEVQRKNGRGCEPVQWYGNTPIYHPFDPKWLLIEDVEGMMINDVKFGNMSQFSGNAPIPASLYSIGDMKKLFDKPFESPPWERFKIQNGDRIPLTPGNIISVDATFPPGREPDHSVHCVFIGNEPFHRNWECETRGTLIGVSITGGGPMVEVDLTQRGYGSEMPPVRIPIKPSDVPLLVDRIGRPVRFKLQTDD